MVLFDGHDLNGWQAAEPGHPSGWIVKDGILTNSANAINLVSEKEVFSNFSLDVEFRILPHGNSGIALRGRYELQLVDDADRPPSNRGSGAILGRVAPSINGTYPAGEWQTISVRALDRTAGHGNLQWCVRVYRPAGDIDGPTGIALDANESEPGPILLQGDRGQVEFRKLVVYPLSKQH